MKALFLIVLALWSAGSGLVPLLHTHRGEVNPQTCVVWVGQHNPGFFGDAPPRLLSSPVETTRLPLPRIPVRVEKISTSSSPTRGPPGSIS